MIPIDKNELYERLDKDKQEILEKMDLIIAHYLVNKEEVKKTLPIVKKK
jgi:hypothetical protein